MSGGAWTWQWLTTITIGSRDWPPITANTDGGSNPTVIISSGVAHEIVKYQCTAWYNKSVMIESTLPVMTFLKTSLPNLNKSSHGPML